MPHRKMGRHRKIHLERTHARGAVVARLSPKGPGGRRSGTAKRNRRVLSDREIHEALTAIGREIRPAPSYPAPVDRAPRKTAKRDLRAEFKSATRNSRSKPPLNIGGMGRS